MVNIWHGNSSIMTVWGPTCILIDSLKPVLYFNMRVSNPSCILILGIWRQLAPVQRQSCILICVSDANPIFECKYEASTLNQGPNQVRGTEMNRGLLATKNSLCARPNASTAEPRPKSRGRCVPPLCHAT